MKKLCLLLCIILTLVLFGCEKTPAEQTVPTTAPAETTPPTTLPSETTALPETEPAPVLPLLTISVHTDLPLLRFASFLYSQEGQESQTVERLPEGYVYAGYTAEAEKNEYNLFPNRTGQCFNLPGETEYYANPYEPEYIYYACDGGYQRLIRVGLQEYTSEELEEDPLGVENYFQRFFLSLLEYGVGENYYNMAADLTFGEPAEVDLGALFYNGFSSEKGELTQVEIAFLQEKGQEEFLENMVRVPKERMEAALSRFFGIGLSEAQGIGIDGLGDYNSQTNSYYTARFDMRGSFVKDVEATYDTDAGVYHLTIQISAKKVYRMTLKQEGNVLKILSNQPV